MNSGENLWNNFSYNSNSNNCLPCDKDFCDAYTKFLRKKVSKQGRGSWSDAKRKENELHLDLFPEPFFGDPSAPIYLLGGNPGYGKDNDKWKNCDQYNKLMAKNLVHNGEFVYFNKQIQTHGGYTWWTKHVNEALREKIFDIEFFPYHTQKLDSLKAFLDTEPDEKCGSNEYADELIKQAMKMGKIIIITRMQAYWFKRIRELDKYEKLYIVMDHQSARIAKGNIISYSGLQNQKTQSWNALVDVSK